MRIADYLTSRRQKAMAAVGLVIFLYIAWRLLAWIFGPGHSAPDTSVPVVAGQAIEQDVPLYLDSIGTVRAYNTVTVRSRVDGELTEISFQEGQNVKKGDVLAQIDPRPLHAALENTMGNLARDEATLANAKRDLARYQELEPKGFATRKQLDTQLAAVNTAEAAVKSSQASVRNANVQLGYTSVKAPIDGRTGIRQVDVGNIIHATDQAGLVVITQIQPISVLFTLPQSQLSKVVEAQGPLKAAAFDSNTSRQLDEGELELVDNQIDQTTGTVRLKARFPNDKQTLWPGQFVDIRLQVGTVTKAVMIPSQVVQRGPQGQYAFVIKADNTIEMRQVKTGQERDGNTLVTEGLAAGERVVVDGQLRLVPGSKVRIAEDKSQPQNTGAKTPGTASR